MGMQIFNFVGLSVIIAPHNVLTPPIIKTHLPVVWLNVRKLELNWCSKMLKRAVKEKGSTPLCGGRKPNSPLQSLKIY